MAEAACEFSPIYKGKVCVKAAANKGKGLFATCALKEGDQIFIERPLISCQFSWNRLYSYMACDHCLKSLETAENMARRLTGNFGLELIHKECCEAEKFQLLYTRCPYCNVCHPSCLNHKHFAQVLTILPSFFSYHGTLEPGGGGGTCPHFSRTRAKCPFPCNLVTLLENFENAKLYKQYTFPSISECLSLNISQEEHSPSMMYPDSLADLYLRAGATLTLFHHGKCFGISLSVLAPRESV